MKPWIRETKRPALLLAAAFSLTSLAWAHAVLVHATPAPNATLHGPSTPILLQYNSRIDPTRSSLDLVDPHGHEQRLAIDPHSDANQLRSHADHLTQGDYTLRWQVLATDGHITRGVVSFAVR
jgi:methionine-rich copper-binding protein CopC